jgi:hypothetical protein
LAVLWSALYAWDEALEELYDHFCWLVSTRIVHFLKPWFTFLSCCAGI